jgi:hypothetical protein
MRILTLVFVLAVFLAACGTPATPAELDAAVSALVEHGGELTPRELDRETAGVLRALYGDYESPYELPSGRTVAWTAERVLDHIWYLPSTIGKTAVLLPQYDYDWECALTVYDVYGREIFHREVWVE